MADKLGDDFMAAVRLVAACTGKIFVTGAALSSGTMAQVGAHAVDLGWVRLLRPCRRCAARPSAAVMPGDILIAFSKAGKSAEQPVRNCSAAARPK